MNLTKGVCRYTTVDKQKIWQVLSLQIIFFLNTSRFQFFCGTFSSCGRINLISKTKHNGEDAQLFKHLFKHLQVNKLRIILNPIYALD